MPVNSSQEEGGELDVWLRVRILNSLVFSLRTTVRARYAIPCAKRTKAFQQGGGSSPLFLPTVRRAQKYPQRISIWLACPERLHSGLRLARARISGYHNCQIRLRVTVTLSIADRQPSEFRASRV